MQPSADASVKNEISRLLTPAWSCLRESLLSKRSPHGWPGGNPVQEGHEPWPSAHIDLVNFRPIQDRIGISVSDSKCLTREIGLLPKLAIQYVKSPRQILYRCLAPFGADGVPKRSKAFVQLGSDEVNKLQKMPSRHSVGDHEPRLGSLVGQVLKDNRVFSQHVTRIEFEGWNRALGIDAEVIATALGFFVPRSTFSNARSRPASLAAIWGASEQAAGA